MIVAHMDTTQGRVTIGISEITHAQYPEALHALMETLRLLKDPVVLTSTDIAIYDSPGPAEVSFHFRYLGQDRIKFESISEYSKLVVDSLAMDVLQCPVAQTETGGGKLSVLFERFAVVNDEAQALN